jgi:uncharacterized protein
MSETNSPYGARAHARAMGDTQVEAMPFLPPRTFGLDTSSQGAPVVWDEVIEKGGYASHRLKRGTRLELTDTYGDACASVLVFNSECTVERLNVADTQKVQWNAYLQAGSLLLSDMGRVLMSIVSDDALTHDCFCGPSNATSNAKRYGAGQNHSPFPNARDRFKIAMGRYGMGVKDIHPAITFFKGAKIQKDGTIAPLIGPFAPERKVVLRAEMDVIIVIANCPHILDARADYNVTPLAVKAWQGAVTPASDPMRRLTPEGARAFLNTDDYYAR